MKTASEEVSRKLERAGVNRLHTDKSWYYVNDRYIPLSETEANSLMEFHYVKTLDVGAPTACELGELLPSVVNGGRLQIARGENYWDVDYIDGWESSSIGEWFGAYSDTLADAMGLMLIWLKENGHLDG